MPPKIKDTQKCNLSPEEIQEAIEMIRSLDWSDYWRRVDEAVAKECDAYRESRRKAMEMNIWLD